VQLTLAKAQLAMAEALRALSSGASLPVVRTAPAAGEDGAFPHRGVLEYDEQDRLVFIEDGGAMPVPLECLADQGKRIRLEFTLSEVDLLRADSDRLAAQFNALGTFLRNRAGALVLMEAKCAPSQPMLPRKTPATPRGPTQPPEPSAPPNPPPPKD
jgi:hypothetical protein